MSLIPAGALADLRSAITNTLPDSAVIARSGATVACRVSADTDKSGIRVPGIPSEIHLARWILTFKDGVDVRVGDYATVAGKGIYTVLVVTAPTSYSVATTAYAIQLGTPVICSVLRQPSALNPGQTAAFSTHIASLNVYPLAGFTFIPASPQFAEDAFGVQMQQPAVLYAGWPSGSTEIQPVQPNDVIVLPDTSKYVVAGVQCWSSWRMAVTVELAIA